MLLLAPGEKGLATGRRIAEERFDGGIGHLRSTGMCKIINKSEENNLR